MNVFGWSVTEIAPRMYQKAYRIHSVNAAAGSMQQLLALLSKGIKRGIAEIHLDGHVLLLSKKKVEKIVKEDEL